jgi:plastocyanin
MKKIFLIGGIFLLMIVSGCSQESQTTQPEENKETKQEENMQTPPKDDIAMKGNTQMMMQPQTPAPLTEEQNKQLKAGEAPHGPTTLTFDVTGGSFYFTPNVIRVKKGDTVKIVFTNAGGMHNFVLDEFNVKMDPIKDKETRTVEFIADKTGSFEYYCSVGSHRQMGQKGTLIVE